MNYKPKDAMEWIVSLHGLISFTFPDAVYVIVDINGLYQIATRKYNVKQFSQNQEYNRTVQIHG
jgi:hypothetical protein